MSVKKIDPTDTYIIREMFSCGEGHFMCPGFSHWESGEVCPMRHRPDASNEDVHLYYRLLAIPERSSNSTEDDYDSWEFFNRPENAGKWGQAALAPKGAAEGDVLRPGVAA